MSSCSPLKLTAYSVASAIVAVGITLFILWILEKAGTSSAFSKCPSCPISSQCKLAVNWWKFPNSMWPNQRLTTKTKDSDTDTLQKAQAWVLNQSKVLTYTNENSVICTPVVLSYPKDPNATQFSYGHMDVPDVLDTNPDLDTYIFASAKPSIRIL
jgi:hypothetical protein